MPAVVILSVLAVSMSLAVLTWSVLAGPNHVQARALANLQRGGHRSVPADVPAPSLPSGQHTGLGALARRLTPGSFVRRLERLHGRAGRPAAWPVQRLLVAKLVLSLVFGGLSLLVISGSPSGVALLIGAGVTVVAYFVPELLLHSRGQERSQQITLELADTLDQMTIAVEAGLGFDSAMARAGKNGTGPLAQELVRTLQDIQVGQSRRQAYGALAERTDSRDLRRFVRAVIQADSHGIAIADVLRTQADEMRLKRRQRAEEKAMQIPVKVIFPLIVSILPVLFIVLLGPAVMDIVAAFS